MLYNVSRKIRVSVHALDYLPPFVELFTVAFERFGCTLRVHFLNFLFDWGEEFLVLGVENNTFPFFLTGNHRDLERGHWIPPQRVKHGPASAPAVPRHREDGLNGVKHRREADKLVST